LGEGTIARGRPARHHRELDSAWAHRQRTDPAQLQSRAAREGGARGHSGRRVRSARGCRKPGLLPRFAARPLHYRYRHSGRRRHAPLPVLKMAHRFLIALLLALAQCAWAQNYPTKPIRLVVPFAPGGSSSIVARSFAAEMSKALGQEIYIENKGGGGGNVAMNDVAHADADGYSLIIGHVGSLAMTPFMEKNLGYDVDRDFAPVSLLAKVPNIFVVHESVPARNLREFVALAKKEPGKLNYGSAGNGSAGHLAMEYLKLVAGIDLQHVPYKGTGRNL